MPADDKHTSPPASAPKDTTPRRYKVLSGGVAGAGGVGYYTGAILTAEQIGDDARIAKLLARGAIEATTDAA